MPQFIRIIFALTMCMLFGAACAVEEDSAADTELTIASNVADPANSEDVATEVSEAALAGVTTDDSVTALSCTSRRMNNAATFGTCRSFCSGFGLITQSFNNSSKICRCCLPGPF
jgi:hypothetical protein